MVRVKVRIAQEVLLAVRVKSKLIISIESVSENTWVSSST